jgi:hypothetical protein
MLGYSAFGPALQPITDSSGQGEGAQETVESPRRRRSFFRLNSIRHGQM